MVGEVGEEVAVRALEVLNQAGQELPGGLGVVGDEVVQVHAGVPAGAVARLADVVPHLDAPAGVLVHVRRIEAEELVRDLQVGLRGPAAVPLHLRQGEQVKVGVELLQGQVAVDAEERENQGESHSQEPRLEER